jgi:hypothetical protein
MRHWMWLLTVALGCAHAPSPVEVAARPSPVTRPSAAPSTRPPPPTPEPEAQPRVPAPRENRPHPARQRLVRAATELLESGFRGDCSSFVLAVYQRAGQPLSPPAHPGRSQSEAIFLDARPVRRPQPGDLAVFHDTYDRNRDGKWNDRFTHIAVVEAVDWPRVTLLHRGGTGVARLKMNLEAPADRAENSILRKRERGRARGRDLAGQLFAGFGTVLEPPVLARRR